MNSRTKTSKGVARRIMRLAVSKFAISVLDIMKTYQFTERHARRYLQWMQDEGLIYLRYKQDGYFYYSVTRNKRDEVITKIR